MCIFIDWEKLLCAREKIPLEHVDTVLRLMLSERYRNDVAEIRQYFGIPVMHGMDANEPCLSLTPLGETFLGDAVGDVFCDPSGHYKLGDEWLYFIFDHILYGEFRKWPMTHQQYWKKISSKPSTIGLGKTKVWRTKKEEFRVERSHDFGENEQRSIGMYMAMDFQDVQCTKGGPNKETLLGNMLIAWAIFMGMTETEDIRVFIDSKFRDLQGSKAITKGMTETQGSLDKQIKRLQERYVKF